MNSYLETLIFSRGYVIRIGKVELFNIIMISYSLYKSVFVDEPEGPFDALKRAGVPIIRFGEFLHKSIIDGDEFPEAKKWLGRYFSFLATVR